jgi:hypothetical protein
VRAPIWSGWPRFSVIALGSCLVVLLPLQSTAALPVAIGFYAIATAAPGAAMIEQTVGE